MAKDESYHDYIVYDLLGDVSGITSRAMFGGWAMYRNGVIFGIIAAGGLYFKVDDKNRPDFEKMGSHPFVYAKKDGKPVSMSYWLVPEDLMEDKEKFYDLLEKSVDAGRKKKP